MVFQGAERVMTVATTLGSGIGGVAIAWYKVRRRIKHAAAQALEAELKDQADIEACRQALVESQLVSHEARISAVEARAQQSEAAVQQLHTGFATVVSRIGQQEISE